MSRSVVYLLLSATLLCCFATLHALPMEGTTLSFRCRCVKTTTSFINPRTFRRVEILPAGARCRKTEVLITKHDDRTVCVDPKAKWVNKYIKEVMNSLEKKTLKSPLPTQTSRAVSA
ncbi:interleukin-8-like [Electrophorus electricus]|uniref:Chemokine interleukin-8-like domain-containing protein n=1 Tax=Electrophorus electricus TaxID=8005 RepID=A0A4W4DQY1_ELEEL|nr:interleukin-8-like [Electrophorus electricus]